MCTFVLESGIFSECWHWRWRGKRHCQHQVVIKPWRASQSSTTAGSCVMVLSWVPPKPQAALAPIYGPCLAVLAQIIPPICSSQDAPCMSHVASVPDRWTRILPILLWSYGSTNLGLLLLFYLSLLLHAYQYRSMQSQWLFKWMQVWANVSFLNIKKNMCDFQSFITSSSV